MNFRIILWIIVTFLIFLYIRYYYKYPLEVGFVQSSLDSFSMEMLLRRQPIIIDDQVQDIESVGQAWFDGKLKTYPMENLNHAWFRNPYKWMIVYPQVSQEVYICGPRTVISSTGDPEPDSHVVAIQLKPYQLLLVPLHWNLSLEIPEIETQNVWIYGYHDYITWILPKK